LQPDIPQGPARLARDVSQLQKENAHLARQLKEAMVTKPSRAAPLEAGMYEAKVARAVLEILTGKPVGFDPRRLDVTDEIQLVRSSDGQHYYRVTEAGCGCKGWHFSSQRYGVGRCRHYAEAFPEQAARNALLIQQIKAERKPQARPEAPKPKARAEEPRDPTPAEMEELKELVTAALKEKHPLFDYVRVESDGLPRLTIRYKFKDDYTEEEETQVQDMIEAAQNLAPKEVHVCASSFL